MSHQGQVLAAHVIWDYYEKTVLWLLALVQVRISHEMLTESGLLAACGHSHLVARLRGPWGNI
jgi:hypothetical protein